MNMNEELFKRLKDHEDGFTERKAEGASNNAELRKTLVAFANSVPEGKTAILFIGVHDDGTPIGIRNPESLQKTINEVAKRQCFPPLTTYQIQVIESDGKSLLAVVVKPSNDRPHFSGPAYVRVGSQSTAASGQVYEELIASRNTKAGKILRSKDHLITFRCYELDRWGQQRPVFTMECRIEACDAHVVTLLDIAAGRHFSLPLEITTINLDQSKRRMMLVAPSGLWLDQSGV